MPGEDAQGHYKILTDGRYTDVGCAFVRNQAADMRFFNQGLWTCDFSW